MSKPRYRVEEVRDALIEAKGLVGPTAEALGCDYSTVTNYVKRHPTLAQVQEVARGQLVDKAESMLYKKISEGDTTAIIFALKTVGKRRGYVERREFAGVPDQPVEVVVKWSGASGGRSSDTVQ